MPLALRSLLKISAVGMVVVSRSMASTDGDPGDSQNTLWYAQPAAAWTEALPIGNGRLGGMEKGRGEKRRGR